MARVYFFLCLLSIGAACDGVIPPDPYMGTIDPSGFDPLVAFPTNSNNQQAACLQPRRGFGGSTGLDGVSWIYLAGLSAGQLDVSNASDPARTLPPSVYQLNGCNAPEGRREPRGFDPRLNNYREDVQYPVVAQGLVPALSGAASEPARLSTYMPWHVVVPVDMQSSVRDRMGCNDVKGERSLLERAGFARDTKKFPESGPQDFDFHYPSRDAIRAGQATMKDWPMVSVAVPIMKTPVGMESCPFVMGNTAKYPRFPGDPNADFQFPSQHWLRGLLGGYLDGGDLPISTDPQVCKQIPSRISTGKACMGNMDCNADKAESCSANLCVAPLPVCPLLNDLYVPVDEVWPRTGKACSPTLACNTAAGEYCYNSRCFAPPTTAQAANPMASPTVSLPVGDDPKTVPTRTADVMAVFSATPGQPGFSPVCRLRFFDKSKLDCGRIEPGVTIALRPLCSAQEIAQSTAQVATKSDYYVHCLFLQPNFQ